MTVNWSFRGHAQTIDRNENTIIAPLPSTISNEALLAMFLPLFVLRDEVEKKFSAIDVHSRPQLWTAASASRRRDTLRRSTLRSIVSASECLSWRRIDYCTRGTVWLQDTMAFLPCLQRMSAHVRMKCTDVEPCISRDIAKNGDAVYLLPRPRSSSLVETIPGLGWFRRLRCMNCTMQELGSSEATWSSFRPKMPMADLKQQALVLQAKEAKATYRTILRQWLKAERQVRLFTPKLTVVTALLFEISKVAASLVATSMRLETK